MLDILWEASVTAAYASAILIVLRLILRKRAPRQVLCLLWLGVFARLLVPVSPGNPPSLVPEAASRPMHTIGASLPPTSFQLVILPV